MCCPSCLAIPLVTVRLLVTSLAILYGQRLLVGGIMNVPEKDGKCGKWTRRITFAISVLFSLLLAALAIFLLVLSTNDDYRRRNMAGLIVRQNMKGSPLDVHRCSIMNGVHGRVLEYGPGPGTNFKCFHEDNNIEEYVAIEPNRYFEEEMRKERDMRNLTFPLRILGMRGEDEHDDATKNDSVIQDGSFDVVILTHVLCSVDSVVDVLANAQRALRPGGRMLFMEHVLANPGSPTWYEQRLFAPILYIIANGCTFRDTRHDIKAYLGDRFDITIEDFYAPMPLFMHFVRPHIKGVAIKK